MRTCLWEDVSGDLSAIRVLESATPLVILVDVREALPPFDEPTFSAPERERARRFRLDINRREFLAARGVIRSVIASHAAIDPGAVVFEPRGAGKPQLLNPECAGIDVSLSHAAGRVACGFQRAGRVGVDIEALDHHEDADTDAIARRMFSDAELDALSRSRGAEPRQLFLRAWTRKEAVLKGAGVGLSIDPRTFDTLRVSETGVKEVSPIRFAGRLWNCRSLSPMPKVELAVASSTS